MEAALSAISAMSLSPMVVVGYAVDYAVSQSLGTVPMQDRLPRWGYALLVYGVVVTIHYATLVRRGKAERIVEQFRHSDPYGESFARTIIILFFIVPVILLYLVHKFF